MLEGFSSAKNLSEMFGEVNRDLLRVYKLNILPLQIPSETVEKADFGSLVLLRDHNFAVCPIW
jgi:hypothetical protein